VNPHLELLLSVVYDRDPLTAEHLADLRKSGLTDAAIEAQGFRTVPPHMIDALVGYPTPRVVSTYVLPYPDPRGGWFDHVRLKIFPSYSDDRGQTVKYLQPRRSGARLYLPVASLAALQDDSPILFVEGEKKAALVAQLGRTAVGFAGVECWHPAGSRDLLPDFDLIALRHRTVDLVPDGDWRTNRNVAQAVERFALALELRGARVRVVVLPEALAA
jgi:hypothetical protein